MPNCQGCGSSASAASYSTGRPIFPIGRPLFLRQPSDDGGTGVISSSSTADPRQSQRRLWTEPGCGSGMTTLGSLNTNWVALGPDVYLVLAGSLL